MILRHTEIQEEKKGRTPHGLLAGRLPRTLNGTQLEKLERTQHICTRIILGSPVYKSMEGYIPYPARNFQLGLQPLKERWESQFMSFVKRTEQEPRFERFYVDGNSEDRT